MDHLKQKESKSYTINYKLYQIEGCDDEMVALNKETKVVYGLNKSAATMLTLLSSGLNIYLAYERLAIAFNLTVEKVISMYDETMGKLIEEQIITEVDSLSSLPSKANIKNLSINDKPSIKVLYESGKKPGKVYKFNYID